MANIFAFILSFVMLFSGLLMFLDGSTGFGLLLLGLAVAAQTAFWAGVLDDV